MGEIISKPWGQEEIIINNGKYVIKRLTVNTRCRLSLQYHRKKRETWLFESGYGDMQLGNEVKPYFPGIIVELPPGTVHRISAQDIDTVILEVSTPELDDIVRLEDDYGRTEKEEK